MILLNERGESERLVFEEDRKDGLERTCSRCGRKYQDTYESEIPICSACITAGVDLDPEGDQWVVRKRDGRRIGPTNLEELKELLKKGFVDGDDLIGAPGKTWFPVRRFEPFRALFPTLERREIATSRRRKKIRRKGLPIVRYAVVVVAVAVGAFYVFHEEGGFKKIRDRVFTSRANAPKSALEELSEEIKAEVDLAGGISLRSPSEVDEVIARAKQGINRDRLDAYSKAAKELREAFVLSQDNVQVLGLLGEVEAYLGWQQQKLRLEKRALKLAGVAKKADPSQPYGYRAELASLLHAGNFETALAVFEGLKGRGEKLLQDGRLQLYLGVALLGNKNRRAESVPMLLRVSKKFPTQVEVLNWLAEAGLKGGDYSFALKNVLRRLEKDPNHPRTLFQRAQLYEINRQYKEAIRAYQKVLRQKPEHMKSRFALSFLYYQVQKKFQAAERNLTDLLVRYGASESDRRDANFHLALIHYLQRDDTKALGYASKGLEVSPYFVPLLVLKARILIRQGKAEKALETLEKAKRIGSKDVRVLLEMSKTYRILKQRVEAIRLITEQQEKNPNSLELFFERGVLFLEEAQIEQAEKFFRNSLEKIWLPHAKDFAVRRREFMPATYWQSYFETLKKLEKQKKGSTSIKTALAVAAFKVGRLEQSKKYLKQAIHMDSAYYPPTVFLADLYAHEGAYEQAVGLIDGMGTSVSKSAYSEVVRLDGLVALKKYERALNLLTDLKENEVAPEALCRLKVIQGKLDLWRGKTELSKEALYACAAKPVSYYPAIYLVQSAMYPSKYTQSIKHEVKP